MRRGTHALKMYFGFQMPSDFHSNKVALLTGQRVELARVNAKMCSRVFKAFSVMLIIV